MMMTRLIQRAWYNNKPHRALIPLSWLYRLFVTCKKRYYQKNIPIRRFCVPIVVVGNLVAGGTGKTPLVITLANFLKANGFHPGIVSRGYRGRAKHYPLCVTADTSVSEAGDEALLLQQRTACPVFVDPNRPRAVATLLDNTACDVILSDDGLQHYALWRDIEIIIIDEARQLGNGYCLPAGPLREPADKLDSVDYIVYHGQCHEAHDHFRLRPVQFCALTNSNNTCALDALPKRVHAVAGIGNPGRFFTMLNTMGYQLIEHCFADHHNYRPDDLNFNDALPIVMTAKDAVKCRSFADKRCWYLEVEGELEQRFLSDFLCKLQTKVTNG